LGLLLEGHQGKEHLASLAFSCEQHAVDHPVPIGPDLENLALQMPCHVRSLVSHLFHCGKDRRLVSIRELADELQNRPPSGGRLVVAPAALWERRHDPASVRAAGDAAIDRTFG
jgi:hypothetical protein